MRAYSTLAICIIAGVPGIASAAPLTVEEILNQYNGVSQGNFQSSQEVEGRVYVNGDLTGNAIQTGFVPLPAGTDANVVVNGRTTIGKIAGQTGKVYLNDPNTVSTTIERQGPGPFEVYTRGAYNGNDNFKVVKSNQGDLSKYSPEIDFGQVSKYSTYLASLSGASYDGSSFKVLNNAIQSEGAGWDASKVTVYNTTFSKLQSGSFNSDLKAGSGQTMIINVAGNNGYFGINPSGDYARGSQILWNFYEATDVNIDRKVVGAILAPQATLSGFSGSTEGSVLASNINLNNGELHLQAFKGDLPTVVPEIGAEGAFAAMTLVLGGIAVLGERRRRVTV